MLKNIVIIDDDIAVRNSFELVPAPILKLLGGLSKMSNILQSIADINDDRSDTVMM